MLNKGQGPPTNPHTSNTVSSEPTSEHPFWHPHLTRTGLTGEHANLDWGWGIQSNMRHVQALIMLVLPQCSDVEGLREYLLEPSTAVLHATPAEPDAPILKSCWGLVPYVLGVSGLDIVDSILHVVVIWVITVLFLSSRKQAYVTLSMSWVSVSQVHRTTVKQWLRGCSAPCHWIGKLYDTMVRGGVFSTHPDSCSNSFVCRKVHKKERDHSIDLPGGLYHC